MNCTNCGVKLISGAKFCENCGMTASAIKPEKKKEAKEEKKEEKAPEKTEKTSPEQEQKEYKQPQHSNHKMTPKWFVIVSMILSVLTAAGIGGAFIPAVKEGIGVLMYAIIFIGAVVGSATLFYIFCLIFFLAKNYGHGSKLVPILHLILYILASVAIGILSPHLYQSQIAMALLIAAATISFIMLCIGLYFLLQESHEPNQE